MSTVSLKTKWDITEEHLSLWGGLEIGKGNYIQSISESNAPVLIMRPNRKLDYKPGTVISLNKRRETFSVLNADEILSRLVSNFPVEFSAPQVQILREKIPAVLENASVNFRLLRNTFSKRDSMKFECLFKAHLRAVMANSYPEFKRRLLLNSYLLSWCCLSSRMMSKPTSEQFDLFVGNSFIRETWEEELKNNEEFSKVFGSSSYEGLDLGLIEYLFLNADSFDDCGN